jgi:hypothetical protein
LKKTKLDTYRLPAGKRVKDVLAEVFLKGALRGELGYLKELLDRTEGKATLPTITEGQLVVKVHYMDRADRMLETRRVELIKSEQSDNERAAGFSPGNRGVRAARPISSRNPEPAKGPPSLGEEDEEWT